MDSQPPVAAPRHGFTGVAIASLAFALAFLPAPLAVLYTLNDECLRTTSRASGRLDAETLFRLPTIPVSRDLYLMVRTAALGAVAASLFLLVTAAISFRSRPWAIRLHSIYVAIQCVLMIALLAAANRFSTALDAAQASRDWVMHLPFQSSVRSLAGIVVT